MDDRKQQLLNEIVVTMTKLVELALEAKALGIPEGELARVIDPVLEKFGGMFDDK